MSKGPYGKNGLNDTSRRTTGAAKTATRKIQTACAPKSERSRNGYAGVKVRPASLTKAERNQIAKKAAAVRWE